MNKYLNIGEITSDFQGTRQKYESIVRAGMGILKPETKRVLTEIVETAREKEIHS